MKETSAFYSESSKLGLRALYKAKPAAGNRRVEAAMALAFPSSTKPLLFRSSGTRLAPVRHKIAKSTVVVRPSAEPPIISLNSDRRPAGSKKIPFAAPEIKYAFANTAKRTQLNILFSNTFLVNHPKSSFLTEGAGDLVIMKIPKLPNPARELANKKGVGLNFCPLAPGIINVASGSPTNPISFHTLSNREEPNPGCNGSAINFSTRT
mmetsp:Transcript_31796/g.46852  ORF Transcript_31796/g.46852 Transcript_31796/m.46852 type:complete len:208 (-) Transcript_31796:350-973(-)